MMMMECLIYERGVLCGGGREPRVFARPRGYVDFARKWAWLKANTDMKKPDTWPSEDPPEFVWKLLQRYPVATSCDGRPDPLNPRGSGYYGVAVIELSTHSSLRTTYGLTSVIACKEQLLNRYTSETAEAWPIDALVVAAAPDPPAPTVLGPISERTYKRNGLWLTTDDEVFQNADRDEDDRPSDGCAHDSDDPIADYPGADYPAYCSSSDTSTAHVRTQLPGGTVRSLP
jgi:hypothetical protein